MKIGHAITALVILTVCGCSGGNVDGSGAGGASSGGVDGTAAQPPDSTATSEPCSFQPRAGWARGTWKSSQAFVMPEAACVLARDRKGRVRDIRFAFGAFDPNTEVAPLVVYASYTGRPLVGAAGHLSIATPASVQGTRQSETTGRVDFDPATRRGAFVPALADDPRFEFACDPADDLAAEPRPIPEQALPGTAIVTRARYEDVHVLDGVVCELTADRQLRIRRIDRAPACTFSVLELLPLNGQPIVGPGTYPAYFKKSSAITTAFLERDTARGGRDTVEGTLDVSSGPPYRGFATFQLAPGFRTGAHSDRVEFSCSEAN